MRLRLLFNRLLALARKRRFDEELEAEIRAHLELAERDALARGLSADDARRTARMEFGAIELIRELHRERRSLQWLDILFKDARYGIALLWRERGFAAAAVAMLALGIGANAAMFSLIDAVLLKPLPFPEPHRLVRVWEAPRPGVTNATSTLDFLDWQRLGTSFAAMTAEQDISVALTGDGEPQRLPGKAVTADYFAVFRTPAAFGRTFSPEDDRPGATPVIVISHETWQTMFGGDPDVLSRRPVLDGIAHQIVGVMPPGVFDRGMTRFWRPLVFTPDQLVRDFHWLTVHGRLHEGATLETARAEMRTIEAALEDVTPSYKRDWKVTLEPLDALLVRGGLRRAFTILFGAAAFVLLIACANVTNLLIARGAARRTELAVRAALGAGRGRLLVQLLTESLVLCAVGALAGLAIAWVTTATLTSFLGAMIPQTADPALDVRVVVFAGGIALAVAVVVGVLPSLRLDVGELARSLQSSPRSPGAHGRLRRLIVVAEVALSMVLLCSALLFFRSLVNLRQIETGIRIENVITMSADLPLHAYPTAERAARFYETVAGRIEAVPGVVRAGLASHLPLQWIDNGEAVQLPGFEELINVRFKRVDAGYFPTLDIPLLAGRGISVRDSHDAPRVAVVNEALAARLADLSGRQSLLGQTIVLHCPEYIAKEATPVPVEVVGVIRSERVGAPPGRPDPPVAYVPLAQVPRPDIRLVVRGAGEPASILAGVRDAVGQVDRHLPLGDVATMRQVRERTLEFATQPAWLIACFAAIASLLAALGLYGVLSYTVTQRRREFGVRVALGARPGDVLALVLRSGFSLIVAGLVLGVAGALALTRVLENLLFEVQTLDPAVFAGAGTAMLVLGLLAGLVPAARATRLAPIEVLREN